MSESVKPDITRSPNLRGIIIQGVKAYGVDYVKKCIEYVNGRSTTNYPGYLNMAIRGNWAADWVSPAEKQQAQIKAEQEKNRRAAEKLAEIEAEKAKIERERNEREFGREKFIALPEADKEALKQKFFNDPNVNMFQKKEARKRADISKSPSFLFYLKKYPPEPEVS